MEVFVCVLSLFSLYTHIETTHVLVLLIETYFNVF